MFATDSGEPVLILTSGAHRVDTARTALVLGATELRRASADTVYAATGQRIGGVAPVGHPAPLRTVVDRALEAYPRIWAAGGIPHAVFPTTFGELCRLTGGTAADVGEVPEVAEATRPTSVEPQRALPSATEPGRVT